MKVSESRFGLSSRVHRIELLALPTPAFNVPHRDPRVLVEYLVNVLVDQVFGCLALFTADARDCTENAS